MHLSDLTVHQIFGILRELFGEGNTILVQVDGNCAVQCVRIVMMMMIMMNSIRHSVGLAADMRPDVSHVLW